MPSQSTIIFDKHYTPDILQIQKKNLVYRNPESDFSVQAEFVTGHIYNIVVKGNANIHDIRITLEIGDLLITRLREKGYSGNFHSIITINDLNSITPEARKMVLKKMDQWQEFEAFIMVGANAFIKTLINVYKRFNPSFKVFFANDQNFALDNIIKLISKSLNVLQQKFLDKNFISKNNWYWKSTNGDYSIKISFLDENIYIVEPKGYAQNSDVEHANKLFNSVLDENNPNREKYYRIQDYSQMTGASKLARQIFVNWMKENINQMHLSVFYGLTGVMKTIVLFGKVLYPNSSKIHIAKSLREALNIVSKHKNGIDLSDETTELIKSDFVIPESKEELTDMLQILIDENSLLKSFNEENSRKLFEIVAKISWDYNLDTQNENIVGEPFSDLFNAIQMLKNDVNDLLKEREFHIAQLTESEEKYYSLFDSSPDSILIIEENTISDCNKKALDIFKLAKKQIVGKRISDFLTDDSDIIFDFFPNYKNIKFIETKMKKNENSLFDAEMQINKLDLKRRQFIQLIIRDITEKNAAQSELEKHRFNLEKLVAQRTIDLEKAKLKAEESDKLKTTFLANMSHEIRTPMNVIIGFADMLLDSDYSHEKQKEYLTLINNSGSALLKLINDIIDLSKIEANQLIIEKKQFNVIELLKEIERNFCETRNQQKKEDILIQMICKNKDISVFTDIFRLKQILTNLLNNALKFTKKGKIVFGCKKTGKFVQFFVNDTGIGIPDSMKEVVFEQFRQIDESTTKEYEGTGLGLTISKNLVLLLGGEIWVESELNVGSSFKFTIPVSDEILDIPETSLKSNVINYQNWLGKNLLVVEDENMNYKFIYEILYPTGIKIIRASDSVQAMEKLRTEKKINIILMDIQLPGQNGYETTKQIKALYPDIKVIAQTAFAMAGEREKCIAAGCNDYIAKPIRKKNLLNIIDKYL